MKTPVTESKENKAKERIFARFLVEGIVTTVMSSSRKPKYEDRIEKSQPFISVSDKARLGRNSNRRPSAYKTRQNTLLSKLTKLSGSNFRANFLGVLQATSKGYKPTG